MPIGVVLHLAYRSTVSQFLHLLRDPDGCATTHFHRLHETKKESSGAVNNQADQLVREIQPPSSALNLLSAAAQREIDAGGPLPGPARRACVSGVYMGASRESFATAVSKWAISSSRNFRNTYRRGIPCGGFHGLTGTPTATNEEKQCERLVRRLRERGGAPPSAPPRPRGRCRGAPGSARCSALRSPPPPPR